MAESPVPPAQPPTDQPSDGPATDHRPARRASKQGGRRSGGLSRRFVLAAGRRAKGAAIDVTDGGKTFRLGWGEPMARVTVHDRRAYGALLLSGSVGLGTSYVAGWWDTDDLTGLVRALSRHTRPLRQRLDRLGRAGSALLDVPARLAAPDRDDDKRNIAEHYDISNDFFALMLDETMTYSCAVFERPGATLAEAQETKIDRLCAKLELAPDRPPGRDRLGLGRPGRPRRHPLRLPGDHHHHLRRPTHLRREAGGRRRPVRSHHGARPGLAGPHRPVRQAGVGRDGRGGGLALARSVPGQVCRSAGRRRAGRHPGHRHRRPQLRAGQTSPGLRAPHGVPRRLPSLGGLAHRQPGPRPPTCGSWTWRTSDATTPRHCDAGRTILPATPTRWRASRWEPEFRRLWDLYLAYCEASFLERHISDVQLVLAKPGRPGRLAARPG